jgi:hypothetical protein
MQPLRWRQQQPDAAGKSAQTPCMGMLSIQQVLQAFIQPTEKLKPLFNH